MIIGESLVCDQLIKSRELMTRDRAQGVLLLHPGSVAAGGVPLEEIVGVEVSRENQTSSLETNP